MVGLDFNLSLPYSLGYYCLPCTMFFEVDNTKANNYLNLYKGHVGKKRAFAVGFRTSLKSF